MDNSVKQYLYRCAKNLENGIRLKGWKKFKSNVREMEAYYNKKLNIVLKNPRFIMENRTPLIIRVPTIKLADGWVVQPFVSKTNLKMAVEAIRKDLEPYLKRGIFPDIHVGNVGWYNGKAVMFDW